MKSKLVVGLIIIAVFLAGFDAFLILDRSQLKGKISLLEKEKENRAQAIVDNIFVDGQSVPTEQEKLKEVKDALLTEKKTFLFADLSAMKITMYKDGVQYDEVPIVSKGREGSWWETPTGSYTVQLKSANVFSSLGQVWMPWSMQFYGNFFIHGWPYYPGGKEVPLGYSGGCIRLATADAKKVYDFVSRGTPVLISEDADNGKKYGTLGLKGNEAPKVPELKAEAALVANIATGDVFLSKNSTNPMPIASLTKLMTATAASELINLDRSIRVSSYMLSSPVQSYQFEIGKSYRAFDLLYPLLMESSNGAAEAIAAFMGRDAFISGMNKKAEALSMKDSHFVDPAGIEDANVSTAKDLLSLARYVFEKRRFIYRITEGENNLAFGATPMAEIPNFNDFLDRDEVIGSKMGITPGAKQTSLVVLDYKDGDIEAPIAVILLGSPDRRADGELVLNWLRDNFKVVQ